MALFQYRGVDNSGRAVGGTMAAEDRINLEEKLRASGYWLLEAEAKDGRWLLCTAGNGAGTGAAALTIPEDGAPLALVPGGKGRSLRFAEGEQKGAAPHIDVVFPVLHGPNGEDGTIQGWNGVCC